MRIKKITIKTFFVILLFCLYVVVIVLCNLTKITHKHDDDEKKSLLISEKYVINAFPFITQTMHYSYSFNPYLCKILNRLSNGLINAYVNKQA